jgi:hypothetical protein
MKVIEESRRVHWIRYLLDIPSIYTLKIH